MEIQHTLKKYGLSEHEITVYLNLLKHVESTVFDIAKETKIPRPTVYRVLSSLENMNLVSMWKKNNVAYFTAESPQQLIKILDEKKELISKVLPDMFDLRKHKELVPTAKIYTGTEGLKIVWDDILDTAQTQHLKEIHAISHPDITEYLPKYFKEWLERREKLGVFAHLITRSQEDAAVPVMQNNAFRETRVLPSGTSIDGIIDIYGTKIAFFSLTGGEIYSIIIESATMAHMLRSFFMATWKLLEKK